MIAFIEGALDTVALESFPRFSLFAAVSAGLGAGDLTLTIDTLARAVGTGLRLTQVRHSGKMKWREVLDTDKH